MKVLLGLAALTLGLAACTGTTPTLWTSSPHPFHAFIPGQGGPVGGLSTLSGPLTSVACTDSQFCFAAGNGGGNSLMEAWNGTQWVAAPNSTVLGSGFQGIACPSQQFCMAVGYSTNGSGNQSTLSLKWDGAQWTEVVPPNTSSTNNRLNSVSCLSSSSCVAVGYSFDGTTYKTLIETWSGTAWTIETSPNVASVNNQLTGVSCVTGYCMAVGETGSFTGGVVETSTNNTTWTIKPSSGNAFASVACVSSTFCMLGGDPGVTAWNGSTLTALTVPAPQSGYVDTYTAVACVSTSFCAADEVRSGLTPHAVTATELTWTGGTTWAYAAGADTVAGGLVGISCPTTTFCATVGQESIDSGSGPIQIIGRG